MFDIVLYTKHSYKQNIIVVICAEKLMNLLFLEICWYLENVKVELETPNFNCAKSQEFNPQKPGLFGTFQGPGGGKILPTMVFDILQPQISSQTKQTWCQMIYWVFFYL